MRRDPVKTARNKHIDTLTERLNELLPDVLAETGIVSQASLHGQIGSKNAEFIDIKSAVIYSSTEYITRWLQGFENELATAHPQGAYANLRDMFDTSSALRRYMPLFLERTHLRNYEALMKERPSAEDAVLWIGQRNATYGLLVTPRFRNGQWENDQSEIRHFRPAYWTIGHVLETGLVVPFRNEKIEFRTVDDYLNFFSNVLVRISGSRYELALADIYNDYVRQSENPLEVRLLIPEFRYDGIAARHRWRLDFTVIDQPRLRKIGMELSPWSTHGELEGISQMSVREINAIARGNFEEEMLKHKDYFRRHGIFTLIYTDRDLADMQAVFNNIRPHLESQPTTVQLNFHLYQRYFE